MDSGVARTNKYGLTGVWRQKRQFCFDLQYKGKRVRIKGFQTPYLAAMARDRIIDAFDLPNRKSLSNYH
jgi:hypothetical protein